MLFMLITLFLNSLLLLWKVGFIMKKSYLLLLLLCALLLVPACGNNDDSDDNEYPDDDDAADDDDNDDIDPTADWLRVGFARVEITPTDSVIIGGYGLPSMSRNKCRWSEGVHDPLYAYGVAVVDPQGASPVILLVLDTVGIMSPESEKISQGVKTAVGQNDINVVVSATHTHNGPDTVGLWGSLVPITSGRDENAINELIDGAIAAGVAAWEAREPAQLGTAVGFEAEYHENRIAFESDPDIDDTMTLVTAINADGKLLGTLMNWACHPTVMGQQNLLLTSGWPGAYRRLMADRFGGMHIFIQGAIGDAIEPLNPVNKIPWWNFGLSWGTWEAVEEFATVIADDATELVDQAKPLAQQRLWLSEVDEFPMTLENVMFWAAATAGLIPREAPQVGETFYTPIATFAIGDLSFATLPGEYATEYGFSLREIMGGSAQVIVGLGMDWLGYTITPEQYENFLLYYYQIILSPSKMGGENMLDVYRDIWEVPAAD